MMTPGYAKPRAELPWLPYPESDRMYVINAHNFGGGTWTPAEISTYTWLDFSDANTLYDATSGGSLVAPNGTIARVQDKSGNAKHFTQSTSGARPTRRIAQRNGLDVCRFDGIDDFLIAATASDWIFLHSSTNATIYCVHRVANTTSPDTFYVVLGTRSSGPGTGFYYLWDDRSSISASQRVAAVNFYNGTSAMFNRQDNVLAGNVWAQTGFINRNSATIAAERSEIRVNAGAAIKTNTDLPTISSATPTSALRIGSGVGAFFMPGDFGEIIIRQGVDDDATRQTIEGYLAHKWGLTASLPSDHPYKSVAP